MRTKTIRLPSYLTHNGHNYCFRIRVPPDLTNCINRTQIKFSLGTGSVLQARSKALSLAGNYKELFKWVRNLARMGKLTENQIQEIVDIIVDLAGDTDVWNIVPR